MKNMVNSKWSEQKKEEHFESKTNEYRCEKNISRICLETPLKSEIFLIVN